MSSPVATLRGRETRDRIVRATAKLVAEHGAAGTTLDDVRAETGASKSQLYHYFGDKRGLVEAVVHYQCAAVLGFQAQALASVGNWEDLQRWAEFMADAFEQQGSRGGCPIGTLAAALADTDERFRTALNDAFESWRAAIGGALVRLRENHLLAADADLEALTTTTLAAIQGGLLLAKTSRDSALLRAALEGAIAQLRAHGVPDKLRPRRR